MELAADEILAEVEGEEPGELDHSLHGVLLVHPWSAAELSYRSGLGPRYLDLVTRLACTLERVGLPREEGQLRCGPSWPMSSEPWSARPNARSASDQGPKTVRSTCQPAHRTT